MQDEQSIQASPPAPIDGARVAQSVVEYTGNRLGAVTYRGRSSRREYRFDATRWHRRNYVLDEDLDLFRSHQEFRVLEDGRIDPDVRERARRDKELADLRSKVELHKTRVVTEVAALLDDHEKREQRRPARKSGGRPGGRGFGAKLDCWMNCGRLEQYFGTPEAAYDALYRHLQAHPPASEFVPPRSRFPSVRSGAKRKREKLGVACLWHRHPERIPSGLTEA